MRPFLSHTPKLPQFKGLEAILFDSSIMEALNLEDEDTSVKNILGPESTPIAGQWAENEKLGKKLQIIRDVLRPPTSSSSSTFPIKAGVPTTPRKQPKTVVVNAYDSDEDSQDQRGRTAHYLFGDGVLMSSPGNGSSVVLSSPVAMLSLPGNGNGNAMVSHANGGTTTPMSSPKQNGQLLTPASSPILREKGKAWKGKGKAKSESDYGEEGEGGLVLVGPAAMAGSFATAEMSAEKKKAQRTASNDGFFVDDGRSSSSIPEFLLARYHQEKVADRQREVQVQEDVFGGRAIAEAGPSTTKSVRSRTKTSSVKAHERAGKTTPRPIRTVRSTPPLAKANPVSASTSKLVLTEPLAFSTITPRLDKPTRISSAIHASPKTPRLAKPNFTPENALSRPSKQELIPPATSPSIPIPARTAKPNFAPENSPSSSSTSTTPKLPRRPLKRQVCDLDGPLAASLFPPAKRARRVVSPESVSSAATPVEVAPRGKTANTRASPGKEARSTASLVKGPRSASPVGNPRSPCLTKATSVMTPSLRTIPTPAPTVSKRRNISIQPRKSSIGIQPRMSNTNIQPRSSNQLRPSSISIRARSSTSSTQSRCQSPSLSIHTQRVTVEGKRARVEASPAAMLRRVGEEQRRERQMEMARKLAGTGLLGESPYRDEVEGGNGSG